jgi:hypothetical protein
VRRLHGSDDLELGETREIVGGNDLGVFDAVATVAGTVRFGNGFKDV